MAAGLSRGDLAEVMDVRQSELDGFRRGTRAITDSEARNVLDFFQVPESAIDSIDSVDLGVVSRRFQGDQLAIPERYLLKNSSRMRVLNDIMRWVHANLGEDAFFWILQQFQIPFFALAAQDTEISLNLVKELCTLLRQSGARDRDFVNMGMEALEIHRGMEVGTMFASARSSGEAIEVLVAQVLKRFDTNCAYSLSSLDSLGATIRIEPRSETQDSLGSRTPGSQECCLTRDGRIRIVPAFAGFAAAFAVHSMCIHRGDPHCESKLFF